MKPKENILTLEELEKFIYPQEKQVVESQTPESAVILRITFVKKLGLLRVPSSTDLNH
jgi:hypothetical protein